MSTVLVVEMTYGLHMVHTACNLLVLKFLHNSLVLSVYEMLNMRGMHEMYDVFGMHEMQDMRHEICGAQDMRVVHYMCGMRGLHAIPHYVRGIHDMHVIRGLHETIEGMNAPVFSSSQMFYKRAYVEYVPRGVVGCTLLLCDVNPLNLGGYILIALKIFSSYEMG